MQVRKLKITRHLAYLKPQIMHLVTKLCNGVVCYVTRHLINSELFTPLSPCLVTLEKNHMLRIAAVFT